MSVQPHRLQATVSTHTQQGTVWPAGCAEVVVCGTALILIRADSQRLGDQRWNGVLRSPGSHHQVTGALWGPSRGREHAGAELHLNKEDLTLTMRTSEVGFQSFETLQIT